MSRRIRRFEDDSTNQIIDLFDNRAESNRTELIEKKQSVEKKQGLSDLPLPKQTENWRKRLLYPIAGFSFLILFGLGVMGKNGWLPSTDSLSGKRTGWFGRDLQSNNLSSSNGSAFRLPFEPVVNPTPAPQLSKEYIYAGSRMLAVEDANASAVPPADLAVWRPSDGVWYVINSSNQQWFGAQFGSPDDKPQRGDFDADGKTDLCVYRPSNGTWYIMPSGNGGYYGVQFGLSTDKPVPADYDGDGKTDIAVFRPSNQDWYVLRSSDSSIWGTNFGTATDFPVPADYDGDGKADVAQYRKSTADWFVLKSGSGNAFFGQQFGQANTDEPVIGDYDGDGKYDFATWRSTDNTWNILKSSNYGTQIVTWGDTNIDTAVQGDFDADGKTDIAVWRKSGGSVGLWQIRNSSTGQTRTASWGTTGDIPVPAPYRR